MALSFTTGSWTRRQIAGTIILGSAAAVAVVDQVLSLYGRLASGATVGLAAIAPFIVIAMAALFIKARLAVSRLQQAYASLARDERRYRHFFEKSKAPLFEQDFSPLFDAFDDIRAQGWTDFGAYVRAHPNCLQALSDLPVFSDMNAPMLQLLGAPNLDQGRGGLQRFKLPDATLQGLFQQLFDGKPDVEMRVSFTKLTGEPRVAAVTMSVIAEDDRARRVVGSVADITERERAQAAVELAQTELSRASRAAIVGALSAGIAHELNQPIGAVVMNAQTALRYLRRELPDIAAAASAAEKAAKEAIRASAIVQETRDLIARTRPREDAVNLKDLIEEVLALLAREIKDSAVQLRVQTPNQPALILADRTTMQQILINLLTNGVQAMAAVPSQQRFLVIDVTVEALEVVMHVRDHGPGIPKDHLARIFEFFFTTREGGMGMGLAISRAAVEAQGGTLRVANHPDGGADFECRWPLMQDLPRAPSSRSSNRRRTQGASSGGEMRPSRRPSGPAGLD